MALAAEVKVAHPTPNSALSDGTNAGYVEADTEEQTYGNANIGAGERGRRDRLRPR